MNLTKEFPILEFDDDKSRIISPEQIIKKNDKISDLCVLCFLKMQ